MNPITDIEKEIAVTTVASVTGIKPIEMPHVLADARREADAAEKTVNGTFLGMPFAFARLGFGEYFWSCMLIVAANFPLLPSLERAIQFIPEARQSIFGGLFFVSSTFSSGAIATATAITVDVVGLLLILLIVSWSRDRRARREAKDVLANPLFRAQAKLAADVTSFNALLEEPATGNGPRPERAEYLLRKKQEELLRRLQNQVIVPPPTVVP